MQTARLFTEDRVALWTSSLWFGCSPFILFELTEGRPTQAIVGVLCLFLRSLWRSTQRDGIGSAVAAGLLLAVAGYQYWFYAFFGGMAALAHGLMRTARPPPDTPRLGILARHGHHQGHRTRAGAAPKSHLQRAVPGDPRGITSVRLSTRGPVPGV